MTGQWKAIGWTHSLLPGISAEVTLSCLRWMQECRKQSVPHVSPHPKPRQVATGLILAYERPLLCSSCDFLLRDLVKDGLRGSPGWQAPSATSDEFPGNAGVPALVTASWLLPKCSTELPCSLDVRTSRTLRASQGQCALCCEEPNKRK